MHDNHENIIVIHWQNSAYFCYSINGYDFMEIVFFSFIMISIIKLLHLIKPIDS